MFLHRPIMYFQSDVMLCTRQGGYPTNNPQHHSAGNDIKPCHWILADDAQHTTEYEYLCREPSLNAIEKQPSIKTILISFQAACSFLQLLAASQVHDFCQLSVSILESSGLYQHDLTFGAHSCTAHQMEIVAQEFATVSYFCD